MEEFEEDTAVATEEWLMASWQLVTYMKNISAAFQPAQWSLGMAWQLCIACSSLGAATYMAFNSNSIRFLARTITSPILVQLTCTQYCVDILTAATVRVCTLATNVHDVSQQATDMKRLSTRRSYLAPRVVTSGHVRSRKQRGFFAGEPTYLQERSWSHRHSEQRSRCLPLCKSTPAPADAVRCSSDIFSP